MHNNCIISHNWLFFKLLMLICLLTIFHLGSTVTRISILSDGFNEVADQKHCFQLHFAYIFGYTLGFHGLNRLIIDLAWKLNTTYTVAYFLPTLPLLSYKSFGNEFMRLNENSISYCNETLSTFQNAYWLFLFFTISYDCVV